MNITRLKEVIDEYVKLGYNTIFLRALNPYGNAIKNKKELEYSADEFIEAYKDALNYIIQLNRKGIHFTECFTALFLSRILTPFSMGFVDLESPSGAGISGAIYNYDGKIYPADEDRMLARMGNDYFCMGTVNDSYAQVFHLQSNALFVKVNVLCEHYFLYFRYILSKGCKSNKKSCKKCATFY